ncbi:hypothetical protein T11_13948 [Trichinella zimbabwensis]|uniref:Uncharacterized protein n=2 Tax=Trichinella TaxID=6333 RepID=A0A0V1FVZ5_TRIPS|nr:hypothetical protein T4D_4298 [Trichinella pseudospiralis]KRZ01629.1 hypothetical protein T11_13948 [Trichinella zimbabwensis]
MGPFYGSACYNASILGLDFSSSPKFDAVDTSTFSTSKRVSQERTLSSSYAKKSDVLRYLMDDC